VYKFYQLNWLRQFLNMLQYFYEHVKLSFPKQQLFFNRSPLVMVIFSYD